jgi:hypothetical protein
MWDHCSCVQATWSRASEWEWEHLVQHCTGPAGDCSTKATVAVQTCTPSVAWILSDRLHCFCCPAVGMYTDLRKAIRERDLAVLAMHGRQEANSAAPATLRPASSYSEQEVQAAAFKLQQQVCRAGGVQGLPSSPPQHGHVVKAGSTDPSEIPCWVLCGGWTMGASNTVCHKTLCSLHSVVTHAGGAQGA